VARFRSPCIEQFREGLCDLGYVQAENIIVEYRCANGIRVELRGTRYRAVGKRLVWLNIELKRSNFAGSIRRRMQSNLAHATTVGNDGRAPPGTRIFSPHAVARLCDTIGRYWYLFKRLTPVSAGPFCRFEHIVTYSSGKVVAKSVNPFDPKSSHASP
jgi:hypothetical protein